MEIYVLALSRHRGVKEVTEWMSKTSGIPVSEICQHRFLLYKPFDEMLSSAGEADLVFTITASDTPLFLKEHVKTIPPVKERIANRLLELNPHESSGYVQISNLYASDGRWDKVMEVRRKMRAERVNKKPGCSMIEVDGVVHEFLAGEGLRID